MNICSSTYAQYTQILFRGVLPNEFMVHSFVLSRVAAPFGLEDLYKV